MVANKADLAAAWDVAALPVPVIELSARTGVGIQSLRHALAGAGEGKTARDTPAVTNLRHVVLLERARDALRQARDAAATSRPASLHSMAARAISTSDGSAAGSVTGAPSLAKPPSGW